MDSSGLSKRDGQHIPTYSKLAERKARKFRKKSTTSADTRGSELSSQMTWIALIHTDKNLNENVWPSH
jgi:hypothetical protein